MKILWRIAKEATKYKGFYLIAVVSTFLMTMVNLAAPQILSAMTAVVEQGTTAQGLSTLGMWALVLTGLFLLRIVFRYLSNYLAHKAAWNLVEDLRVRVYGLWSGI